MSRFDKQIVDGKNVYDFIDPDIEAKLAALEEEEERLEQEGFYKSDSDLGDESEEEILQKAEYIREKHKLIRNEAKMKKSLKNRAIIPRKMQKKSFAQLEDHIDQLGVDTEEINLRGRAQVREPTRGRSLARSRNATEDPDAMEVDTPKSAAERLRSQSRPAQRGQGATNRRDDGVTGGVGMDGETARSKAERVAKLGQRKMNRMARAGEADRHIGATMPKHLVCLFSLLFLICLSVHKLTNHSFYSSLASVPSARHSVVNLDIIHPSIHVWVGLCRASCVRARLIIIFLAIMCLPSVLLLLLLFLFGEMIAYRHHRSFYIRSCFITS